MSFLLKLNDSRPNSTAMFNFMHPVSVFRRKPVAELTVRQTASYQALAQAATAPWLL